MLTHFFIAAIAAVENICPAPAFRAWAQVKHLPEERSLAKAENIGPTQVDRILRLALLCTGIIEAAANGNAPLSLMLERLKEVKLSALS